VDKLLKEGYHHIVDVDIKSYFDTIPHKRLIELVTEKIADGGVLTLIEQHLKQGILQDKQEWEPGEEGSPQRAVISPLLANIYLNPLDWLMVEAGIEMVRYADNSIAFCKSAVAAQQALENIQRWCEEAALTLHPDKTRIVDRSKRKAYIDFLGYRFYRTKRGTIARWARPKSEQQHSTHLAKETVE
jgi:RNA-directed DNA polymerase